MTRAALARAANVAEGSVERLENGVMPSTARFPRAYAWILSALDWPPGCAQAVLAGTQAGPPVRILEPSGGFTSDLSAPKVDKLRHLWQRKGTHVIVEEIPSGDLIDIVEIGLTALAERGITINLPGSPSSARP